ncbi:putative membrane protein [Kibdelosporangium banguiense]|uniref:Membrane protein n=1 Tax=Kibdelosporangium banguiense TaxID=1365924 RepID=A0ABS4TIK6_9PSEU|nr:hypothetical protein [Kibdelosporangium banguiense]MBP2324252.1 putative membrane protein [Kibdelosporangium banguiense]
MTQSYGQQQHHPGYPQTAPPQAVPLKRPGTATASAVLGFIQAGFTLIASAYISWFLIDLASAGLEPLYEMWVVDIAQYVGVALLVVGGVQLIKGSSRTTFLVAAVLQVVISLYWIVRFASFATGGIALLQSVQSGIIAFGVSFATLPVIGLIMAATGGAGQYVAARRGR